MMADIMTSSTPTPVLVLDDDPTGAQSLSNAHVLLDWDADELRGAPESPSLHLLTNTRALAASSAHTVVSEAVRAARAALPRRRVVLRGDSTLRGHLLEEYLGCCDGLGWPGSVPLLLVPALPSAGRVTRGGVQLLEREGKRLPVAESEFAADTTFGYRASRLVEWAEERSGGLFAAEDGIEIDLDELRRDGPGVVAEAIHELSRLGRPAVCVPDAETMLDLDCIAEGLRVADGDGCQVVVRCAPAFVGALAGNTATGRCAVPGGRTLLVCGSWVASSSEQLRHLQSALGVNVIEAAALDLASGAGGAVEALAGRVDEALAGCGLAVLATERARPVELQSLDAGERIGRGLAGVVAALAIRPDVLIAKGGVTAAIVLGHGLGARSARVEGPVLPGVSLWTAHGAGGDMPYLVVPGNVGAPSLLSDLVAAATDGHSLAPC